MRISQLRVGLWLIDLEFQGRAGVIASYLIEDAGEFALLEVGPASTMPVLLDAMLTVGVPPEALSKLMLTHIHLDHAGAAGSLVQRFPHLLVYVHEVGAPHLADPSRLLASAARIYGDQMDQLWGDTVAVPSENIIPLSDNQCLSIGNTRLSALYTPGHASHHVAYSIADRREIFTGDVAAIRLQGFDYVRPATPPPEVDLQLWASSLERLLRCDPAVIYLTHFGPFADVHRHLTDTRKQLFAWADFIEHLQAQGYSANAMKVALKDRADAEVLAAHHDPAALRPYELAAPSGMSVDGYLRYFRKRIRSSG